MTKLQATAFRSKYADATGIYVRAVTGTGEHERWGTHDIAELDAPSLLAWLKSHGGDNRLAEDTIGVMLGHGHLHKPEPA